MSMKNVVLIAGVHGVSGRAAAELWTSLPGAQVYGLSRRAAPLPAGVEAISADLLDRDDPGATAGEGMALDRAASGSDHRLWSR
jgi:nucleoside-diphosphate-sugar epimerase